MKKDTIDFTTLSELGLRRLDISNLTLSESCSKSPSVIISQDGMVITRLEYDDLQKAIEFMKSVLNYTDNI